MSRIYTGDSLTVLRTLPSKSVACVVTSPPYYALRNYDVEGQIGLEESADSYIQRLVEVFREVRRVLRDDGTLWINIGDTASRGTTGRMDGNKHIDNVSARGKTLDGDTGRKRQASLHTYLGDGNIENHSKRRVGGIGRKQLLGIPWRLALTLQADGWILRADIIWSKPSCMPENVKDRPTRSHEHVFLLSKKQKYWYDAEAIMTPVKDTSIKRVKRAINAAQKMHGGQGMHTDKPIDETYTTGRGALANARDVWTIATAQSKDRHFAVMPDELARRAILAGCPPDGIVLDPFFGSGTTGFVAERLGREYIGIELNPAYVEIAERRLATNFTRPMAFDEAGEAADSDPEGLDPDERMALLIEDNERLTDENAALREALERAGIALD